MDLKTYGGWAGEGRAVIKGAKAESFLVSPDQSEAQALFSLDQTVQTAERETTSWRVMAAEDWNAIKSSRKASAKKKVKVNYDESSKTVLVWCGNNKKVIKVLQANGYSFDMSSHRWFRVGRDPIKTVAGLETMGLEVELGSGMPVAA